MARKTKAESTSAPSTFPALLRYSDNGQIAVITKPDDMVTSRTGRLLDTGLGLFLSPAHVSESDDGLDAILGTIPSLK